MYEISSALAFGMYALWYLQCSMDGPMYRMDSPYGVHDAIFFGLLYITTPVPIGDSGVRL